jgi:hypothetical protein
MSDRESWAMARLVSRRPLPKERKLHPNTVGEQPQQQSAYLRSCKGCGYHLCACSRLGKNESPPQFVTRPNKSRAVQAAERARISDSSWLQLRYGCCDDCERARREAVTHCLCGRPTGY